MRLICLVGVLAAGVLYTSGMSAQSSAKLEGHTPERSGNFARDEKIYQGKIIHWPEPNAIDDVNKAGPGK